MRIAVKTDKLSKRLHGVTLVNNLTMTVEHGEIYGFLGPNGAGKSTTIKMILGLVKPSEGAVTINGIDVWSNRHQALQSIGAMIENPCFYPTLSGKQNLDLFNNLYHLPKSRVDEVLEMVGLKNEGNKKVRNYSLGMKQRLGIARAFLNHPHTVILDEPTNGLDAVGVVEVRNLIRELSHDQKTTFILCSHILSEVQELCSYVSIINKGELVKEGHVEDLLNDNADEYKIYMDDNKTAKNILSNYKFIYSVELIDSGIDIKIAKGKIGEVNQLMALNNLNITSITKQEKTLESYFLSILRPSKKS